MADEAAGDRQDWERFSKYLNLLARTQASRQLQGKLDLSGVVQQTLLEAHQAAEKFRGQTDEQKAAWLRRILANNLADELARGFTQATLRDNLRYLRFHPPPARGRENEPPLSALSQPDTTGR